MKTMMTRTKTSIQNFPKMHFNLLKNVPESFVFFAIPNESSYFLHLQHARVAIDTKIIEQCPATAISIIIIIIIVAIIIIIPKIILTNLIINIETQYETGQKVTRRPFLCDINVV